VYRLARLLHILTVFILLYDFLVLAAIVWPASGWILALLAVTCFARRKHSRLTTLGRARFAEERDLRSAGLLDAKSGLILGRYPIGRVRRIRGAVGKLLSRRFTAAEACRELRAAFGRNRGALVRLPRAVHTAVFAPTGVGKGVSCVIPFLLTCEESCVVIDIKGELAALTAEARRRMGHRIVILDPWKVVTQ